MSGVYFLEFDGIKINEGLLGLKLFVFVVF